MLCPQIKHRKAELAQEKGGLMAAIGQTIAGPRFYENDEVIDHVYLLNSPVINLSSLHF